MRSRSLAATLVTLWAILACGGEVNDPSPDPGIPVPMAIGDTITVSVDSGTQGRLYTFRSDTAVDVAVFIQTLSGYGAAILKDSTTGAWLTVATSMDLDPQHLLFNRSDVVRLSPGTAYLVQALSAWTPPRDARIRFHLRTVNRRPEILAPELTLADTVTAETLENTADIDEFTLPVTAGEELIAFLKTASGATQALGLQVQVYPPGASDPIGERGGATPQEDIELGATGVLLMPTTGLARIVVRGTGRSITSPDQLTGGYELLVRRVNRAPESIGAVIAVNDTVEGERIEHKGDIDEFTAQVTAGEAYRVFLQTVDVAAGVSLRAQLPHPDQYAISTHDDTALVDQRSSAYLAPATGPITIQVRGEDPFTGLDRGGYRLFLYHINRLPEAAPATITPGDWVLNETVEFPGDVDSFTVTAGPTGLVNYVARHPGAGGPISLVLTWPTVTLVPGRVNCGAGPGPTPQECGGGTHAVLPGGEPLKVVDEQDGYGAYQLRTFAIDTAPEGTPPAIPLGQPVSGEITPAGDADVYTHQVGPDELYDLEFDCSCQALLFNFTRGDQAWWMEGNVAPNSRTGRFAPEAGSYALRVRGAYYGERLDELGSYQFTLRQVPVTPETAGSSLTVPDTVSTELIDSLGDVDQFIVSGPPGQEVLVTLPQPLRLEALEMGSTDTLRTAANGTPGPIVMPAGGQFRLRVFEPRLGVVSITDAFLFTGPYFLVLRQLNRAPEIAAPALTRGVEESNEDIGYIGDIDEFTFDGVAGDTTVVRTTLLISPGALRLRTEFLSPTGAVLASVTDQAGTQTFTPPVELPVTGTYRIRIRNTPDYTGTGRYIVEVQ
jgi:hypothetical protein